MQKVGLITFCQIHRSQQCLVTDGMNKHRLSPYNAYYFDFAVSDSSSNGTCFLKIFIYVVTDDGCTVLSCSVVCCVFRVSDDTAHDTLAASPTADVESREIYISSIPVRDTVEKLREMFENERVTGIAHCNVVSVSYHSNDASRAVVRFSDDKGNN